MSLWKRLRERWQSTIDYSAGYIGNTWLLAVVFLYILAAGVVGMLWSSEPERFDVQASAMQRAESRGAPLVTGAITTTTLIQTAELLLDKRGGFLSNDIFPPGVWLDNIPNWEYGVLIQVRDLSRAMRESFSRSQSQSKEDPDLALAEPRFNFDNKSWILPASESEYREGIDFLKRYLVRLEDSDENNAQFYARADNLRYWLGIVQNRLGSLSQRLTASVGQRRINTDLAGDEAAVQSTAAPGEIDVKTPWTELDDVFYEARGTTWALLQFLRAIEMDFADVLQKKNALISLRQIIRELESCQEDISSPLILNGTGFGLFANHSLVMASYISRANAAIIDLRDLMARG
ncbi:MAG: hypothetical protein RL336_781 [Pseudomonadota bacterium]|jgi:hypothetical protein